MGVWEEDRAMACRVAVEHFLWATAAGQSLVDILRSIGLKPDLTMGADDVLVALERAWLMVHRPYRKARPLPARRGTTVESHGRVDNCPQVSLN